MKPPGDTPRIDVSCEELEALLEQANQEPLREEGYHKLKARDPYRKLTNGVRSLPITAANRHQCPGIG
jgi:hypothetical protein